MADQMTGYNRMVLEALRPGDLIEFERILLYSHWAVYKGDGKVIHLAGEENDGLKDNLNSGSLFTICGKRFNKAQVREDYFWNVVGDSKVYKNNSLDDSYTPYSPEEIVKRAMDMVGEIGYNLLWGKCEHFAKFCRYGKDKSEQVEQIFKLAAILGGVTLGGYAIKKIIEKSKKEENIKSKY